MKTYDVVWRCICDITGAESLCNLFYLFFILFLFCFILFFVTYFIVNQTCNTMVTGSFCVRYCDWCISLQRSQSECSSHDPV